MKNRSIRFVLPLVLFAVVLLSLSCGTPTANENTNANTTRGEAACDVTDINARAVAVQNKVKDKIDGKAKLKNQADNGKFKYKVRKSPGGDYLEAIFEGQVSGDDELKNLADILNDFQKDGCLKRVVFVAPGGTPTDPSVAAVGFEWSSCEWPQVACAGGSCC